MEQQGKSLKGSLIDWKPRLIKRRSLVQISSPLSYFNMKKKKKKNLIQVRFLGVFLERRK
jgi:hypothetical protein